MGNYTSKIFSYNGDKSDDSSRIEANLQDDKLIKNQMCTPVNQSKKIMIDPRSASSGIARTPIESSTTPVVPRYVAKALPKHLHTKKYLETDFDNIESSPVTRTIPDPRSPNIDQQRTPIVVKPVTNYISPIVIVKEGSNELTPDLKTIDPRSPAIAFDRTPILKSNTFDYLSSDKHETSIDLKNINSNITMSYCETKDEMNISEIQALPEINTKKPVNLVDRLNVSDIVDNTSQINNNSCDSICSDDSIYEEQITVIPNLKSSKKDPMIDDTIDEESLDNKLKEKEDVTKDVKVAEEIVGKIRVWRDSTSPQPTEIIPSEAIKNSQEIIIEFDDNSILSSTKTDVTKLSIAEDNINNQIVKTHKVKSSKKDIKTIIDDIKDEAPKCRTPLGNRSNNTKSIELGKSPHQFLRNKALSNHQQENTPPNAKRFRGKNSTNATTWDPDMSIII
ncbi:hypothetical protein HCN44_004168 [Aphidius gifuensis]|uniref:Uncharacterized protein n=1 Tax=Aphidius gifuensis TaxID=684658 RepID=A0A834Y171_APHGI|nr:uncharacterized protein LOC122848411 [Aphidius gifuensis]XP_044002412.1 uncharacterized protein LOC122848411 [Aphidius gifuensis]KAF7994696.1 hypothetical protein HCN44_004168 [Aphidius gifuensis]